MSLSKQMIKGAMLISTGVFAGMSFTLSYVGVPAILSSNDPLPSWKEFYNRGLKIALLTINTSAAAALYTYCNGGMKDEKWHYLLLAALNFAVIPFTLIVMAPVNNTLFRLGNDENSKEEARRHIMTWGKYQLVRTTLGFSAFLTNAYIIFN